MRTSGVATYPPIYRPSVLGYSSRISCRAIFALSFLVNRAANRRRRRSWHSSNRRSCRSLRLLATASTPIPPLYRSIFQSDEKTRRYLREATIYIVRYRRVAASLGLRTVSLLRLRTRQKLTRRGVSQITSATTFLSRFFAIRRILQEALASRLTWNIVPFERSYHSFSIEKEQKEEVAFARTKSNSD